MEELADLVEDGAPRDSEPGMSPSPDYELSSLLQALLPLAGNGSDGSGLNGRGLDSDALQRLVVLTSKLAGLGDTPSTSAKRSLAEMLAKQGRVEDAELLLLSAIDERLSFLCAERQRMRGQKWRKAGDWGLTRNDASYSLLVSALQTLYETAGRAEDEEMLLLEALRFAESFGDDLDRWLVKLSYFYKRQGRVEDQERVLRRTITLHPDDIYIRQMLANLLRASGRPEEAHVVIENLVDAARSRWKPGKWGLAGYLDYAAEISAERGQEGQAAQG